MSKTTNSYRHLSTCLLNSLPGMYYRCSNDSDNTLFLLSERCITLTGYNTEELIQKNLVTLVYAEDVKQVGARYKLITPDTPACTMEYRIYDKSGNLRWVRDTACGIINEDGTILELEGNIQDITKEKLALTGKSGYNTGNVSLEILNEPFNQAILDSLTSEIGVVRGDGTIVYINDAWKNFSKENGELNLGRTCLGANYFAVCEVATADGDAYSAQALAGLKKVLNNEAENFTMEYPCNSPCSERWFILSVTTLHTNERLAVVRHDNITARKKTEQALQENKILVENIYDALPEAVIIINESGHITRWDAKSEALFGWKECDVIGKTLTETIIPEHFGAMHSAGLKLHMETGEQHVLGKTIETRARLQNGNELDVRLMITKTVLNEKAHFIGFIHDISVRKIAEQKIRESEERYRALYERNLAGFYKADLNNIILECNDAFANILGFNTASEIIGKHARELYSNLTYDNFVKSVNEKGGKIKGWESLIETRDGKKIYLMENASLIVDNAGEPLFMEGTLIDISVSKEAETALLKNKRRYKNLLDNMNDGFLVDDIDGKVTFANQRYCEIFGMTKDDIAHLILEDYVAPESRELLRDRHNRRIAGEHVPDTFEYEGLRKDGLRIWLEVRVSAIVENGKIRGTQSIIRDVTEKKNKEIEFKKLAELNRKIIDSSDELFYVIEVINEFSFNNPIVYISNKAMEFYGITEESIFSNPRLWINAIHPDDAEQVIESTHTLFAQKKPVSRIYRNRHAVTGEYIWLYDYVQPILDDSGRITELYGSVKNITDLKDKEAHLKKTANELNDRYNELMQFNYIVSHNLRAPIANIIGLTNILNIPSMSVEEKPMIIQHIQTSTQKMDDLINDLNTILSARSTLNTRKATVSIPQLLRSITDTLQSQIAESGTRIKTTIPENAEEIFTIKSYLESTLYNLISNAIKYKSPLRAPEITLTVQKIKEQMIITVTDNGMGIDLERHGKYMFGLYKRFHLEAEGKGLGLHMTKTQIESMGGKITVESEFGTSTTFTISLPASS